MLPGLDVVARAVAVDRARPRVPRRVRIGHRADDRAVRERLDLLAERAQVVVELAERDRAEAVARRLRAVAALVGQPADHELDAVLARELDELRVERVPDGQVGRDRPDLLPGLLLQRGKGLGRLILVDADADAGDGGGRADRERAERPGRGNGSRGSLLHLQGERALGPRLADRRAAGHGHGELPGLTQLLRERERHADVTALGAEWLGDRRELLALAREHHLCGAHAVGEEAHREAPLLLAQRRQLLLELLHPERDLGRIRAGLLCRRRQHQAGGPDRVALPADPGVEGRQRVVGLDAGRDLRHGAAARLRRHHELRRCAVEAGVDAESLGLGRVRHERQCARLRDREVRGRRLLLLRAVEPVGIAGAADRVDELEQDQRRQLRPHANAAAIAAAAARAALRGRVAAVAAAAEHAGRRGDGLHHELDRAAVATRRAAVAAVAALRAQAPAERERAVHGQQDGAARPARIAVGTGRARGVDRAADEQARSGRRA